MRRAAASNQPEAAALFPRYRMRDARITGAPFYGHVSLEKALSQSVIDRASVASLERRPPVGWKPTWRGARSGAEQSEALRGVSVVSRGRGLDSPH